MADIRKYKLADYIDSFGDGIHGTPNYDENGEYYFINGNNLKNGKIEITSNTLKISSDEYKRIKRNLSDNTLLVSINGTLGNIAFYNNEKISLGKSACFLNLNKCACRPFIRYVLESKEFKTYMNRVAGQSTIKNVSPTQVSEYEFFAPSYSDQARIAKVLSTIDREITINREINRNLEELAKQIYDYWFVQFDFPNEEGKPYKSSGGKMVWNEFLKREIPADWEVKRLGEILVKIDSGKRPAGGINKALKSGIPSLGAECIDDLGVFDFSSTPFIDNSYRNKLTTGKICNNDILVYKDGAYVGKITLFRDNFPYEEVFVNEHVFLIHAQEECLEEYLYFSLKQKAYFQIMQNLGKAKAAQPGLNREDMQNILLIVPNKNIVSVFHNKVGLLFENLFNNARAIGNLSSLRDNLLPLLMNGQVTLNSCLSAD